MHYEICDFLVPWITWKGKEQCSILGEQGAAANSVIIRSPPLSIFPEVVGVSTIKSLLGEPWLVTARLGKASHKSHFQLWYQFLVRNQVVLTSVTSFHEQWANWLGHLREYIKSASSPPPSIESGNCDKVFKREQKWLPGTLLNIWFAWSSIAISGNWNRNGRFHPQFTFWQSNSGHTGYITNTVKFSALSRWLPTRADLSRDREGKLCLETFGNLLWAPLSYNEKLYWHSCSQTNISLCFKTSRKSSSSAFTLSGIGRNNTGGKSFTFDEGNIFSKVLQRTPHHLRFQYFLLTAIKHITSYCGRPFH